MYRQHNGGKIIPLSPSTFPTITFHYAPKKYNKNNKNRLPNDYQEQERGGSPELRHLSGRRKTL